MENSPNIETLTDYVSQLVSLNRRLEKKKVDSKTAKLAFSEVDSKRKGYLDLANVLLLCGDVTEDELFYVFKWLDSTKSGDVSYEDFEAEVTTSQPNFNSNASPVESVKELLGVFLENLEYANGLKAKFGFTEQNLVRLYNEFCSSQQKRTLSTQDLIYILSHSKKWDSWCQSQTRLLFANSNSISVKDFVAEFACGTKGDSNHLAQIPTASEVKKTVQANSRPENQIEQEQLLDDLNCKSLKAAEQNDQTEQKRQGEEFSPKFKYAYYEEQSFRAPTNSGFRNENSASGSGQNAVNRSSRFQQSYREYAQQAQCPRPASHQVKASEPTNSFQVEEMLGNIEKRRAELRRGSVERKKLIEEALSHKKHFADNLEPSRGSPNSHSVARNEIEHYRKERHFQPQNLHESKPRNYLSLNSGLGSGTCQSQFYSKGLQTSQHRTHFQPQGLRNSRLSNELSGCTVYDYKQKLSHFPNARTYLEEDSDCLEKAEPTPKFSQTMHAGFSNFSNTRNFERNDRFSEIQRKINQLKEFSPSNQTAAEKDSREIDKIIEKYRNQCIEVNSNSIQPSSPSSAFKERSNLEQKYISVNKSSNLRIDNPDWNSSVQKKTPGQNGPFKSHEQTQVPHSYLFNAQSRLQLKDSQFSESRVKGLQRSSSTNGLLHKENLLRRAEEEASRKIGEIQRKARMKVLQRKSAVGLRWAK